MNKPFVTLLQCPFKDIVDDPRLPNTVNKSTLCLLEDFEDGKWRVQNFLNFVWDNIAQTALTAQERKILASSPLSLLSRSAKNLRILDNDKTGGEIAEILLYAVMKAYYNALPVVPKIFFKQNRNDFAKAADSFHIVLEDNDNFSIWLGEAKFYKELNGKLLDQIVNSIKSTLSTEKIKKENAIIINLNELSNLNIPKNTLNNIINTLNNDISIDKIKAILHVPILILHECDITKNTYELTETYKERMLEKYKKIINIYYKKQIESCAETIFNYSKINFVIIPIPVPNKSEIVDKFINNAKIFRD